MDNNMKYIMVRGYLADMPFLFSPLLQHDDIYTAVSKYGSLVSAGFVDFVGDEVSAHGKSSSLNISSRPEDSGIIANYLRN